MINQASGRKGRHPPTFLAGNHLLIIFPLALPFRDGEQCSRLILLRNQYIGIHQIFDQVKYSFKFLQTRIIWLRTKVDGVPPLIQLTGHVKVQSTNKRRNWLSPLIISVCLPRLEQQVLLICINQMCFRLWKVIAKAFENTWSHFGCIFQISELGLFGWFLFNFDCYC